MVPVPIPTALDNVEDHRKKRQAARSAKTELTVLATTSVHLPVRTVADGVNRTVMTFVDLPLLACIEVVHAYPRVARRADDEAVSGDRVEGGR